MLFAQSPNTAQLIAEAARLRALPAAEVQAMTPAAKGLAAQTIEQARWAGEFPIFRWLHELLPDPMFQTQGFLFFFSVVFVMYWRGPIFFRISKSWPSKQTWALYRVCLLVVASFMFYASWNASLAFLVTITATADYVLARLMDATDRRSLRRGLMWASILMNIGVLCYFKYRGFFLNEMHDLLVSLGATPGFSPLSPLNILIPFGISFYTFEAISYAVDVCQRKVKAERSLPHFLLFILFFPHLVAGPIVRAGDFLKQTHRIKRWNWVRVQVGVQFVLLGLFKKFAIADRMAVFCDGTAHDGPLIHPELYTSSAVWLAVLAYAFRIYADFSGYSDMAIGTAHLLGYKLTQNFNMPYMAQNVSEFWRRWHISLSTWLRDYVYIPLGGNRGSAFAVNRNLMITMLLGGLWHGSNWSYVIWGGLHGLLLVGHRQFRAWAKPRPGVDAALGTAVGQAFCVMLTFFAVMMCWVFFRPDLNGALAMLQKMFIIDGTGKPLPLHNRSLWYTVIFVMMCHVAVSRGWWQQLWDRMPVPAMGFGYAVCLTAALLLAPEMAQTFIYFTF
ncbi:MAG: MBOAT family O-acyltransferase [Fimbriiglobus sp.]